MYAIIRQENPLSRPFRCLRPRFQIHPGKTRPRPRNRLCPLEITESELARRDQTPHCEGRIRTPSRCGAGRLRVRWQPPALSYQFPAIVPLASPSRNSHIDICFRSRPLPWRARSESGGGCHRTLRCFAHCRPRFVLNWEALTCHDLPPEPDLFRKFAF